jgi:tetratricopeptide (TPR) repeat protein
MQLRRLALFSRLAGLVLFGLTAPDLTAQTTAAAPDPDAANASFVAQDWPTAAAAYQRMVQRDTANGMAWLRLGTSLLNLNDHARAKPALERALALRFNPTMAHVGLARVAAAQGKKEDALRHLGEGVSLGFAAPRQIQRDPNLAAYQGDRIYDSLITRMNESRFPCRSVAEHRQFDFWVGTWNVIIAGTQVGVNTITRHAEGCMIMEDWKSPGQIGNSLNFYDTTMRKWRQIFVYDNGGSNDWVGGFVNGKMVFETSATAPSGVTTLNRMTFTPLGPDSLTQVIEASTDGGKTWTTPWNSVYLRQK